MAIKADAIPAAPAGGRAAVRRGRRCRATRVERVYRYYSVLYIFQDTREGTTRYGLQRRMCKRTNSHEQVRAPHRVSKGTDDQGRWHRGGSVLLGLLVLLGLRRGLDLHPLDFGVEVCLCGVESDVDNFRRSYSSVSTYPCQELHEGEERHPQFCGQELLGQDGVDRGGHPRHL